MNRTFKPNRQGITLLFVISMIVLFLLMGTAFVIVANNFNRASTDRILSNLPEDKGSELSNKFLEEAMFQIIREADLRDIDSPLRGNGILSDQYGYGVKSFVSFDDAAPAMAGGQAFVDIAVRADLTDEETQGQAFNLLTRSTTPENLSSDSDEDGDPDLIKNLFGGQVLSFTTGPARGFSARIYSDFYNSDDVHIFRIPATSISGDIITNAMITDPSFAGSEVIINGRDFSGTGAGLVVDAMGNQTLGPQALLPNRVGQLHKNLAAVETDADAPYLSVTNSSGTTSSNLSSVNEPWDAADVATMFLSGFDKAGKIIASFHRQALLDNAPNGTLAAGRTSFHAFDIVDPDDTDKTKLAIPDVDADQDGENDSFWMDLGMSVSTNREGRRFKPLFAILIKDMEGRLNANAHGNRTHADPDGKNYVITEAEPFAGGVTKLNSAIGSGMGVAEIDFSRAFNLDTDSLTNLLNSRYSSSDAADIYPGDGTSSFRSQAKLFGYPKGKIDPDEFFGTVGRLFGTAMDINGRFQIGSPASSMTNFDDFRDLNFTDSFNNGLPQINMVATGAIPGFTTEFQGNPYEMSLSGSNALRPTLYTRRTRKGVTP